jgi:hypothetical protein
MYVEVPTVVSEAPTKGDRIAVNANLKSDRPDPPPRELDATTSVTAARGASHRQKALPSQPPPSVRWPI